MDKPNANNIRHLNVEGHDVAAVVHGELGERPPVVCLHGLSSSLGIWELALPGWATDRCRIDLSLPGHFPGAFPADTKVEDIDARMFADVIQQALDQLIGDRPVIVVGWSTGGFAAFTLAVYYPQRVLAIASLAGFAGRVIHGLLGWGVWFAGGGIFRRPAFRIGTWCARKWQVWYRWMNECLTADPRCCRTPEAREKIDLAYDDFRQHDPRSLVKLFAAVPNWRVGEQLDQIQVPVLVAGGAEDPIVLAERTRQLADAIPHSELKLFENAGHLFFFEWPGIRDALSDWLARADAALPDTAIEAESDRADNEPSQRDLAQRSPGP